MPRVGSVKIAWLLHCVLVTMSLTVSTFVHASDNPSVITPGVDTGVVAPGSAPSVNSSQKNVLETAKSMSVTPKQTVPASPPLWRELNPAQQQALSPLVDEWDKIDGFRKKKWLEIGNKFSKMKPEEQQRIQDRMRDWAKLTPEQRRIARESYARTKKLGSDQKSEQWHQYQQLTEEQKQNLANDADKKKRVANLPPQHSKSKTVAPIKSTPKPVLEQSVTPQVANQSPIQPSAPPVKK